mgnify:CR=1 FL=1|jgi:hypothetical protein
MVDQKSMIAKSFTELIARPYTVGNNIQKLFTDYLDDGYMGNGDTSGSLAYAIEKYSLGQAQEFLVRVVRTLKQMRCVIEVDLGSAHQPRARIVRAWPTTDEAGGAAWSACEVRAAVERRGSDSSSLAVYCLRNAALVSSATKGQQLRQRIDDIDATEVVSFVEEARRVAASASIRCTLVTSTDGAEIADPNVFKDGELTVIWKAARRLARRADLGGRIVVACRGGANRSRFLACLAYKLMATPLDDAPAQPLDERLGGMMRYMRLLGRFAAIGKHLDADAAAAMARAGEDRDSPAATWCAMSDAHLVLLVDGHRPPRSKRLRGAATDRR